MRRWFLLSLGTAVTLYAVTWVWGVPAVYRDLPSVQAAELRAAFGRFAPTASAAELASFHADVERLRIEIETVVPVFPGIILVKYVWSAGKGSPDAPSWRAVVWYPGRLCFLRQMRVQPRVA